MGFTELLSLLTAESIIILFRAHVSFKYFFLLVLPHSFPAKDIDPMGVEGMAESLLVCFIHVSLFFVHLFFFI